jgi:hypothetical protein
MSFLSKGAPALGDDNFSYLYVALGGVETSVFFLGPGKSLGERDPLDTNLGRILLRHVHELRLRPNIESQTPFLPPISYCHFLCGAVMAYFSYFSFISHSYC